MDYQISNYYLSHGAKSRSVEKALIFESICNLKETTRKRLVLQLQLRPNNVSETVQELIDEGLITENGTTNTGQKGRHEIIICPCPDRYVAISIWVEYNILKGALIDINGKESVSEHISVPESADNEVFLSSISELIGKLVSYVKKRQLILGIGITLPGVVLQNQNKWYFNSRWPNVQSFDFEKISSMFRIPVRLYRMLDAQIEAVVNQNALLKNRSVLLIHWGYGIGGSFYNEGKVMTSTLGSTFEIGHVKSYGIHSDKLCTCKETGCLETVAALWSILPDLSREYGPLEGNERQLADKFRNLDFSVSEIVSKAIEGVSNVVDTVFRITYPDKIIIYGPFLSSDYVCKTMNSLIFEKLPKYASGNVSLELFEHDLGSMNSYGSTVCFFEEKLKEILLSEN